MERTPPRHKQLSKNHIPDTSIKTASYSLSSVSNDVKSINRLSDNRKNEDTLSEAHTISEISDNIFLAKPDFNRTRTASQNIYKLKIAAHLKKIKKNPNTPTEECGRKKQGKNTVNRIKRESETVNAEIEIVRNKFSLMGKRVLQQEKDFFFNCSSEKNNEASMFEIFIKVPHFHIITSYFNHSIYLFILFFY